MAERSVPEQRLFLLGKVLPHLKKQVTEKVPESGWDKKSTGVVCELPGTENEYVYEVIKDRTDKSGVLLRLKLGVLRKGHDREVSHYLCKGTKQEILDKIDLLMQDPDACIKEIMELSDRIDEFYK